MRSRAIILISLLILASSSIAQTQWVQPGAEWHYDYYTFGSPYDPFLHLITYSGDEVIQNKNCQKLTVEQIEIYPWGNNRSFLRNEYLYTSGDTVFYYVGGKFAVLFNFSSNLNDTWDLGVDTTGTNCTASIMRVDSVYSNNINGQNLKHLRLSHDSSAVAYLNNAIERIGSTSYLFPQESYCGHAVPELPYYRLHCYHDDNFPMIDQGTFLGEPHNCQYEYLSVENEKEHTINIYPNPVNGVLIIGSSINGKYSIHSIDGKTQFSGLTSSEIDVSKLNPGIYILKLALNDGVRNYRFVKQ